VPCYRCGTRQADPEPGKPSFWRQGLVAEHQVLVCPACYPAALGELTGCARCDCVRLVRRLDQVECLDCRLTRTVSAEGAEPDAGVPAPRGGDTALAAEVASALARILGNRQ
jgi:hypothetical protein